MSTTSAEVPAGENPAVNGITSLSGSIRMAQNIKAAISMFASEKGFESLSEVIDLIPQLEKDIKEKDCQLKELAVQLVNERKNYTTNEQEQLRIYNRAYDAWRETDAALQKKIQEEQETVRENNTAISSLREDQADLKAKGRELETKFKLKINSLKEKEREATDLKQQLKEAQANVNDHATKLSACQSRLTKLEALSNKNKIEFDRVKEESTIVKERLKEVLSFSAPLKDVNLEDMAKELESLWISATVLVRGCFGQNLPQEMHQNDWDKLRNSTIFKHQIPLPRSNSDIAKEMRVATVLGILARLIDRYVFQPTYLLTEESGFRQLLCHQATVDQRKERFARGTLLSMFPEQQKMNEKDRILFVVEDMFKDASVTALLAPEHVDRFEEELEHFLVRVQETWRSIQHSKQKLEPTFSYKFDNNLHWQNFKLQVTDGREGEHPVSSDTADSLEDELFVIFPRFYLMGIQTRPITPGTVLQKTQVRDATQEIRKAASHTLFEPQDLVRHNRTSRSMSISGDGARGGNTKKRFLSKPAVPTYV